MIDGVAAPARLLITARRGSPKNTSRHLINKEARDLIFAQTGNTFQQNPRLRDQVFAELSRVRVHDVLPVPRRTRFNRFAKRSLNPQTLQR